MVTEAELDRMLAHARSLALAADELERLGRNRSEAAIEALRVWLGPHGRTFAARASDEDLDVAGVVAGLRSEADEWARVWADTVNTTNAERRQARIEELAAERGFVGRATDFVFGDDPADGVAPLVEVVPPRAESGYAPTGGLERF